MKTYKVTLKSTSAIAFGRKYEFDIPHLDRETPDDYEKRTWVNRTHFVGDAVILPPLSIKNALLGAAKYCGKKIPGQRNKTYSAKFASGVLITENVVIGKRSDIRPLWLFVPSDGVSGSGKRVMKCFPTLPAWEGVAKIQVLDEIITGEVLQEFLTEAGNFVGLGALRVQKGGILGRFAVGDVSEV